MKRQKNIIMNHINKKMKAERPSLTGLYFDGHDDFLCDYEPDENNILIRGSKKICIVVVKKLNKYFWYKSQGVFI